MTSKLAYLEEICISNFRAYPSGFRLQLPSAPSVTILSGPNGLGKTSFFEAIEWCLTGAVQRLDTLANGRLDPRLLARQAPEVTGFDVSLRFNDGEIIRRAQSLEPEHAPPPSTGSPLDAVANILCDHDSQWHVDQTNLSTHLQLTHIHPQAASIRFVSFSPQQRWLRVSPLAGADRFDRLRANLKNARYGLTQAMGRRSDIYQARLEARNGWRRRLHEYQTLLSVTLSIQNPSSPTQALLELRQRADACGVPLPHPILETSDAVAASIAAAHVEAKSRASRERAIEGALRSAQELPISWAQQEAQREAITARLAVTLQELERARGEAFASEQAAIAAQASADDGDRSYADAQHRHRLASGHTHHDLELQAGRLELEELRPLLAVAQAQVDAANQAVAQLVSTADQVGMLRARLVSLGKQRAAIEVARNRVAQAASLEHALIQERQRLAQINTDLGAISGVQGVIAAELATLSTRRDATHNELQTESERLAELAKAVAQVASRVQEHDERCPVCRTSFPPGKLHALALQQLGEASPGLLDARQRLDAIERDEVLLRARSQQSATELDQLRRAASSIQRVVDDIARKRVDLLSHPLLQQGEHDAPTWLDAADRQLAEEALSIQRLISDLPNDPTLKADLSRARDALERHLQASRLLSSRLATTESRCSELGARLAASCKALDLPPSSTVSASLLDAYAAAVAATDEARSVLRSKAGAAQVASRICADAVLALSATTNQLQQDSERLQARSESQLAQWHALDLQGQPNMPTVQAAVEASAQRQQALLAFLSQLDELGARLQKWQQLDSLRAMETSLRETSGDVSLEDFEGLLEKQLEESRLSYERAAQTQQASDQLSDAVASVADDFGAEALRPFGNLFQGFLRALIRDERFHDLRAEHDLRRGGGNALSLVLGLDDISNSASRQFPAELVLSEGQLGEVSLAALLASSCAYPWSRWRALLLDDPTQYHDLIHATCLFDVLRNIVETRGYQVFISMHDRDQASFLRRKLESANIASQECEFLSLTRSGAEVRFSGHTTRSL
jgi:DNA repair exonuclease SbcCD ATPase subunit